MDTVGALSPVPGSPFAAGAQPSSILIDPTGKFAYVANSGADTVSAYTIDAGSGALTALPAAAIATGQAPLALAVSN